MKVNTPSTWRRLTAYWLDSLILGLCWLPVWIQLWISALEDQVIAVPWNWLVAGMLLQLFYKWMFLYFLGGTIGKLVMGLRVVPREDPEESLGLMQSLLRVLTDGLSLFFGWAPRALALLRLDRTHVSDWVAETRVVQGAAQRRLIRRHGWVAFAVVIFSFSTQFSRLYEIISATEWVQGQLILDPTLLRK